MKSLIKSRTMQLGLAISSLLLTAMLAGYAILFGLATREVLRLDLRHLSPLSGVRYYGFVRQSNLATHRVLVRSVLDIHDGGQSFAGSHHCDEASSVEFFASALPHLIVASEDRRFYQHAGVDFIAFVPQALRGKGASTVTMQLARTTSIQTLAFPVIRKPYEWALAAALEQNLSKSAILLHYANSIYVGKTIDGDGLPMNMDGVKTAAFHLFAKTDLRTLSLAEGASIVALFTGPNRLLGAYRSGNTGPWLRVRNEVLRRVASENGTRYGSSAADAIGEPIEIGAAQHENGRDPSLNYFFNSTTRVEKVTNLPRNTSVETTLDPSLQAFAAEALKDVLSSASSKNRLELNGALIALDPATGDVRALVGGINPSKSELNRVHSRYSPGSTVKPFLYAAAFDAGARVDVPFTPAFRMPLEEGSLDGWTPNDHVTGVILPRIGLSASSNRAALIVGKLVGLSQSCELERRAFLSDAECSPELLLGGGPRNQVTPLSMAEAYASFANGGYRVGARFTNQSPVRRERLFSDKAAFITTQLLRSSIGDGPSVHATLGNGKQLAGLPISAEVAGKTGSTDTTLWVAVVHPRLIVVVVAGTDSNEKTEGLFGGEIAGAVWAKFVRTARATLPWYFEGQFEPPMGVAKLKFEAERGCLSDTGTAREYFMTDRLPKRCN